MLQCIIQSINDFFPMRKSESYHNHTYWHLCPGKMSDATNNIHIIVTTKNNKHLVNTFTQLSEKAG